MYYLENPYSRHDLREIEVELLGEKLTFLTDSGVFSKRMIDYGGRVLLKSVNFRSGTSLLDVGCGYGPIGLTLAKVQGVRATMIDINRRAINLSQKNADKNSTKADIFQSDLYERVTGTFHHIVSNPPIRAGKLVVHSIIENSKRYLKDDGDLTLVIQRKQGALSAKKRMSEVFGNCEVLKKDKGYYILRSYKL